MKSLSLSFLAGFLLMATAAHGLPLKAYKAAQKADDLDAIDTYIDGVGNAYFWANWVLRADNKEPLFCTPDLALNHDNYLALLDRQITQVPQRQESFFKIRTLAVVEGLVAGSPDLFIIGPGKDLISDHQCPGKTVDPSDMCMEKVFGVR